MTIGKSSGRKTEASPAPDGRPAIRFSPEINTRLGQQLRVLYSEVMNQGMPDRHHDLLQRLDAAEKSWE
jgi:hypothetical protein